MSVKITRRAEDLEIAFSSSDKSFILTINVKEGNITIRDATNVIISYEDQRRPIEEAAVHKEKEREAVKMREVRETIIELLRREGANNPHNALSIDEIIEIAQYNKGFYKPLYDFIKKYGVNEGRKLLALFVAGTLAREGLVNKICEQKNGKKEYKFFISEV